jgi:hypothetical protein
VVCRAQHDALELPGGRGIGEPAVLFVLVAQGSVYLEDQRNAELTCERDARGPEERIPLVDEIGLELAQERKRSLAERGHCQG